MKKETYKILGRATFYGKNYFNKELLKYMRYGYEYICINKKLVESKFLFGYNFKIKIGDKVLLKNFNEVEFLYRNKNNKLINDCKKNLGKIVTIKKIYVSSFEIKENKEYEFYLSEIKEVV